MERRSYPWRQLPEPDEADNAIISDSILNGLRPDEYQTMAYPISQWEELVMGFKNFPGEHDRWEPSDIYYFRHQLRWRDSIQEAIDKCSEAYSKALKAVVSPLDERYRSVTSPISFDICNFAPSPVDRWWHYRVPKVILDEQFRSDVDRCLEANARAL